MSDHSNSLWKWVGGFLTTILTGVIIYYLTEGAPPNRENPFTELIRTSDESKPDKAVIEYYKLINQRQYENAWNTLTPTFQRKKPDNNYSNYIEWWDSVDSVAINSIRIIEQTENKAIVDANIEYTMKSGRIWTDPSGLITLILDVNGKWLINDKRSES